MRVMAAVVAAIGVMGVLAAGASANASFPHGDYNSKDWHEVTAVGCGEETAPCVVSELAEPMKITLGSETLSCNAAWDVSVGTDGSMQMENAELFPGQLKCVLWETEDLPWENQVCATESEGQIELWNRFEPVFHTWLGEFAGEVFGQFEGEGGAATAMNVDSFHGSSSAHYQGSFSIEPSLDLSVTDSPCPWPELQ
jgi:hypothetical protein